MTSFRIERFSFDSAELASWKQRDPRHHNWPVVYSLASEESAGIKAEVYIGETGSAAGRLEQHLKTDKSRLTAARVIVDGRFNKSACLDLESRLIRLLAGDGKYQVLNRNDGVLDADYFDRARYSALFEEIFAELQADGLFTQDRPSIENSDLFKLSPFKALTPEQSAAVELVVEGLFDDLEAGRPSTTVVEGDPGTGKTIVAIFLLKLLRDIEASDPSDPIGGDTLFADYFVPGHPELLEGLSLGLVVPQQSLRASVRRVFERTPGLSRDMVLSPFDVGATTERFDLLIVDEAHRLSRRSNQPSAYLNARFSKINVALFGEDDLTKTQLDWITERSRHQVFLVDPEQAVRPSDLPREAVDGLVRSARRAQRHARLLSQLRVRGGIDYIDWVKTLVDGSATGPPALSDYDLRLFTDLGTMREAILARERESGLARLVAGFAWKWQSKSDSTAIDISIDGVDLRWNSSATDWVHSEGSIEEVGSIHTVQGYDLNYAGVIIGEDLRFDPDRRTTYFDRSQYFDRKGVENNVRLGLTFDDAAILRYVKNIYAVLLTRGIRGTYIYACDPELRSHLEEILKLDT